MTHATQPSDMAGDPIPVIRNHELRLRKLEETLSFRAGNLTGKTAFTQAMVEAIIATKHSVFQLPSDEKAEDSVRPLPGSGPDIALKVKEINENPLNAMCDKEGQTESPLKESDRPTREQVESQIAGWNPPYSAPAEPAPGSDAEHPPLGYRLAKVAEKREPGYVFWDGEGWIEGGSALFGSPVDRWHSSPCANPITANEGDSRAAESVAIPAGWVECKGHHPSDSRQILHPKTRHIIAWASPNRCVPWGEGYEAILPEDAKRGDEYLAGPEWVAPLDPAAWSAEARMAEVWRRKVQPEAESVADRVSDSIADDVQRMQVAIETLTDERDRLRARVAEVEAENAERDAAHKADADLAASLHLENAGLRAVVERNVTSVLVDHARGVLPHRYEGACPDSVEGPDVRDPECPVCRAIDSVSRLRTIGPGGVVS